MGVLVKETQSMLPMVKVSTLFFRVDGFDAQSSITCPDMLNMELGDQFLEELLTPLSYDPGENLVKAILDRS